jgi:hypothetical protein
MLDPGGETIGNLAAALHNSGNPYVPIRVLPHRSQRFEIAGLVRIDIANFDADIVLAAVRAAVGLAFGFDARALGQSVAQSEVIAAMQAVAGVQGVRLTRFSRADEPSGLADFLPAATPEQGEQGALAGAEMLTVDPLALTGLVQWP